VTDQEESDQTRDVYAHFGLAVYLAQCLEQSIFLHLMFVDHFPKAISKHWSREEWAAAFDSFESRELSQTLGKLIRRLKEAGQPTESIRTRLEDALRKRNWLVHGYFSDRATHFFSERGRSSMIEELQAAQAVFRHAAHEIDSVTRPIAHKYGLTDHVWDEMMKQMIQESTGGAI
jgi:hypothetical protein